MTQLTLSIKGAKEGVVLKLPATPAEISEAVTWFDRLNVPQSSIQITGATGPVQNLGHYIATANINDTQDMAKLNEMAESIEQMDAYQHRVFAGALDAESINGLDDVLRISNSLDQYILISGVSNDKELGGFLVESGYKNFPDYVQPYLDYAGIGREYYAERGGAYTSAGYVLRKESVPELSENDGTVFRLLLRTTQDRSLRLGLPATEEEMDNAKRYLRVEEFAQCSINRTDWLPYLGDLIPNFGITVEDANDLALCIEEMQQRNGELLKYLSVLSLEKPETFPDALRLASNLDDYERIVEGTYEYGQSFLRRHGADEELIEALEGYMDFEKFGSDAMEEDGVRGTEFGLIRRCSQLLEDETQVMQMGGM